jgi:hypothetical protein
MAKQPSPSLPEPRTSPETASLPEPQGVPLVPGPGFAAPPSPRPGKASPDALAGDGSASSGQSPRTPIDPDRPSPPQLPIPPGRAKAYQQIAKTGLAAIAGLLNRAIQVDDDDEAFLPDDDDEATIPPPAGRLMARRVPLGKSGDDFSELEDIGMLLVGLVAWGLKGVSDHYQAVRARGPKGKRKDSPGFEPTHPDEVAP